MKVKFLVKEKGGKFEGITIQMKEEEERVILLSNRT